MKILDAGWLISTVGPAVVFAESGLLIGFFPPGDSLFARYGAGSVVLARFVPIVRTFTPIVAGATRMRHRTFATFNAVGGLASGAGVTVLGYILGQIAFVRSNIEFILVGIVVMSVLPIAAELLRAQHNRARAVKTHDRSDAHV